MKDIIKKLIKPGIFIILSLVLLFFAFRNIKISEVFSVLETANYSWVILALIFSVLAFFSRAKRWILLIRPLGYRPSLITAYHALLTGYLFNFAAPRLGELTRCIALGKKEKIPVDRLFGTVIAERAFDLISMLLIMLIMILVRSDLISAFLRENVIIPLGSRFSSLSSIPLWLIILFLTFVSMIILLIIFFRERLKQIRLVTRAGDILRGIFNGIKTFTKMKDKLEFVMHTLIIWSSYILMTWVVLYAIPATSHLVFADAVFLLVIGSLGMAAPVQGGIGAFHWIVSRALQVVYGVELKDGLAYATLSHESQLILIAILGTISFWFIMGRGSKKQKQSVKTINGKE